MQRSGLCRSRRELSNAYLLAKIGVDTAKNEPLEVWGENSIQYSLHSLADFLGYAGLKGGSESETDNRDGAVSKLRSLQMKLKLGNGRKLNEPDEASACARHRQKPSP